MTRYSMVTASLALAYLLSHGQAVRAQYPYGGNPYSRPAVSPYINLLRGGASPAINYSTLVRPDIEYRNSINQLSGQSLANQQAIAGLQQGNLPPGAFVTGMGAGFQNHLVYFNTMTGGPSGIYGGFGGGVPGGLGTGAGVGFGGFGGGNRSAFGAPAAGGGPAAPTPSRGRGR